MAFSMNLNAPFSFYSPSFPPASSFLASPGVFPGNNLRNAKIHPRTCRAMVQQTVQGGASAAFAKEMERLSAKESLLLAFKDAGGFEALVTGKIRDMQRIDVNERIIGLERLNPTPRPTTSPILEGRWNIEWFGSGSPAVKVVLERFPPSLANLSRLDVLIKDSYTNITANLKLLNSEDDRIVEWRVPWLNNSAQQNFRTLFFNLVFWK